MPNVSRNRHLLDRILAQHAHWVLFPARLLPSEMDQGEQPQPRKQDRCWLGDKGEAQAHKISRYLFAQRMKVGQEHVEVATCCNFASEVELTNFILADDGCAIARSQQSSSAGVRVNRQIVSRQPKSASVCAKFLVANTRKNSTIGEDLCIDFIDLRLSNYFSVKAGWSCWGWVSWFPGTDRLLQFPILRWFLAGWPRRA